MTKNYILIKDKELKFKKLLYYFLDTLYSSKLFYFIHSDTLGFK